MARRLAHIAAYACIHAAVTLGLLLYASYGSAARFDGLDAPPAASSAGMAAQVLMAPGSLLWTSWASRNLPNAIEWLLFVANSSVWGILMWSLATVIFRPGRGAGTSCSGTTR